MTRHCLLALSILAAPATAGPAYPNFMNGATLMESCEPEYHFECTAYIKGISDLHNYLRAAGLAKDLWCAPAKTTPAQLRQAVLDYGTAHSDDANQPGSTLVLRALQSAFPCTAPGKAGEN